MRKNEHEYQITPEGSLGLLALGDIGLRAWRKVKEKESTIQPDKRNEEKE
jgi:hypothetical protein